ncbi:MAG: flagellar hook-length control protein FliK [Mesorhizobium sp.]
MTVSMAPTLPGMATGPSGPAPAHEPAPGEPAFRDVLDGRDRSAADTKKAPESAARTRSDEDGRTTGSAHEKHRHGKHRDDADTAQDTPPLRDRLPLLVSLNRLGAAKDERPGAMEDGKNNEAADKNATVGDDTAIAASIMLDAAAGSSGKADGWKADAALPAERIARQASPVGKSEPEAKAHSATAQATDAATRTAIHLQPEQAAAGKRQPQQGTIVAGTSETEGAAGGTMTDADDATSKDAPPPRIREVSPERKGADGDALQQRAGERHRDDTPRTVAVTASQSFAAPASHPMSQTTAALVATISADNGFRQAAAMQAAAPSVALPTHVLKIELRPADLGSVTASLRMTGQQLTVELKPETHEAYRRLEADKDDIAKSLKRLGLGVDSVTVMQPQMAATPAARADAASSATAAPYRDPSSFQPGNPNGDGAAGRQAGHQSERNGNDGRQDAPRSAQASRIGTGGNLFI